MSKYTTEVKPAAYIEYFDGTLSRIKIYQMYGIYFNESNGALMLDEWMIRYQELSTNAFIKPNGNRTYYHQEKIRIIEEYLEGKGSLFIGKEIRCSWSMNQVVMLQKILTAILY